MRPDGIRNINYRCNETTFEFAQVHEPVAELMEKIHSQIPVQKYTKVNATEHFNIREEHFQRVNYKRAVIYQPSNGCEWAKSSGHGCTMCGHIAKQKWYGDPVGAQDMISHFKTEFKSIDFEETPLLNVYNNGSFLNDREVPEEALKAILGTINQEKKIKMVILETRPEFVTKGALEKLCQLIPDKHVEIAMGLEVKDDNLRKMCINKGFNLKQYNNAAELIRQYAHLRTYVLLKPPFLNEKESIDCAEDTIRHAFEMGSDTVSLEGCTVQDYTLVKYLRTLNEYNPPWLWSILQIVQDMHALGKLIVGMFQFFPGPSEVPHNCSECNQRIMDALRQYNRSLDASKLGELECECRQLWLQELEKKYPPLQERIERITGNVVVGGVR